MTLILSKTTVHFSVWKSNRDCGTRTCRCNSIAQSTSVFNSILDNPLLCRDSMCTLFNPMAITNDSETLYPMQYIIIAAYRYNGACCKRSSIILQCVHSLQYTFNASIGVSQVLTLLALSQGQTRQHSTASKVQISCGTLHACSYEFNCAIQIIQHKLAIFIHGITYKPLKGT